MQIEKRELRVNIDRAGSSVALDILNDSAPNEVRKSYRLTNISRSGMFVESPAEIAMAQGSAVHFAMRIGKEQEEVTGVAKVRWVRRREVGPYLPKGIGLQVVEFHDNAERRFLDFLKTCLDQLRISDVMDPDVTTLMAGQPVGDATRLLWERGARAIVIVDPAGAPLGIFTRSDAIRTFGNLSDPIDAHMTPSPVTLSIDQPLEEAYALMQHGPHAQIPIVEEGLLVGMISSRELIRHWAELTELESSRLARSVDRATSLLAHDLRTPTGLVKTTNAMLTSGELTPEAYMASGLPEIIDESCEMMLKLIDDLIDIGRIKAGAVRLDVALMDVEALLKRVVQAFGPSYASKSIELVLEIPQALPQIKADALRLEQVLHNLVSNALKFSHPGTRVTIGAKPQHSRVALWVRDQGVGIAPSKVPALFTEFGDIGTRTTAGEASTGLGLAIVKRLVAAHGGSVEVESTPNAGTTFTVTLPIGSLQ